jgi:hypothetical protein
MQRFGETRAVASNSNAQSMQGDRSRDLVSQQTEMKVVRVIACAKYLARACGERRALASKREAAGARASWQVACIACKGLLESLLWAARPEAQLERHALVGPLLWPYSVTERDEGHA